MRGQTSARLARGGRGDAERHGGGLGEEDDGERGRSRAEQVSSTRLLAADHLEPLQGESERRQPGHP